MLAQQHGKKKNKSIFSQANAKATPGTNNKCHLSGCCQTTVCQRLKACFNSAETDNGCLLKTAVFSQQ